VLRVGFAGNTKGAAYEHWREELARGFVRVDVEPLTDSPVHIQSAIHLFPGAVVGQGGGTASRYMRTRELIETGIDDLILTVPIAPMEFICSGVLLKLSDSIVSLHELSLPGEFRLADGEYCIGIRIARGRLLALCPGVEDRINVAIGGAQSAGVLLHRYLDLVTRPGQQWDSATKAAIGQHIIDLVALVIGLDRDAAQEAGERGATAARLATITADVAASVGRGELSLQDIASRHKVSERYIQRLFERSGTTFTDFVVEQRLLLAHRLLCDPRNAARKVSDIAHTTGFGDVSYFHRAFRRRFGATPAEVRQKPRQENGK
jgi:AraC-like DNA-binding protein